MSSGPQAYWDEIREQEEIARRKKFQGAADRHYANVSKALEKIERLSGFDLAMTKWQHQLMDEAIEALKDCYTK